MVSPRVDERERPGGVRGTENADFDERTQHGTTPPRLRPHYGVVGVLEDPRELCGQPGIQLSAEGNHLWLIQPGSPDDRGVPDSLRPQASTELVRGPIGVHYLAVDQRDPLPVETPERCP